MREGGRKRGRGREGGRKREGGSKGGRVEGGDRVGGGAVEDDVCVGVHIYNTT